MTVDDDCSCECFPPQSSFELASDQPGIANPRTPPAPPQPAPVVFAPPLPPPPPPSTLVIIDRPIGPQTNPNIGNLVLTCPSNISVGTFNLSGTVVNFPTPTATTSQVCSPVSISVNPPSGSFFPMGTTVVNVSAIDKCGRTANCSFLVTVSRATCPSVGSFPSFTLPSGGANVMSFDFASRRLFIACESDNSVQVLNVDTHVITSFPQDAVNVVPHGAFGIGYDAKNNQVTLADQSAFWGTLNLTTGKWAYVLARFAAIDAGNIRQMVMDQATGIAFLSGIHSGANGAIDIVQYSPGGASNIFNSGYTLQQLGENGCFIPSRNAFAIMTVSGTPSFFYVDKNTGTMTGSGLALGVLFGQCYSIPELNLIAFQNSSGKLTLVNPSTDTLVHTAAETNGFVMQSVGYNSCTQQLYMGFGTNGGYTLQYDASNNFAFVRTINTGYTAMNFDPYTGLMYALTSSNLVTTF